MSLSRREFVGGMSAFAGLAAGGCAGLRGAESRAYSVSVLGDCHYDAAPDTLYHSRFIVLFKGTKQHPMRFKEFVRNAKMWAGPSREILSASGRCVTADTAMVLQMGDLIQGDCNDFAVHRRMLEDTARLMKSAYPDSLPFVTTCGNHDIREGGKGRNFAAAKPYAEFARDFHRKELGNRLRGTVEEPTFAFRQGPDLYLVVDFNFAEKTTGSVRRLLDENRDVRHTFIVTHGGVFPFDCWDCRWFYLGGVHNSYKDSRTDSATDAQRREMRALFASRNAIVLCGHTHHLELKEAKFPEGVITEMTMNSMPGKSNGGEFPSEPEVVREGAARYGDADWVKDSPEVAALFNVYRPFMRRYYLANAAGHARMRVSDEGVWFDYSGRGSTEVTKTFRLR